MTTQTRRARARQKMLTVAAEIFRAKGFERSTMEEVARQLGMLKGSLYYYFESKQEILDNILLIPREKLLRRLERVAVSAAPPQEKLRRAIKTFVSSFDVEYPAMSVAVYERFSPSEGQGEQVRRLRRRVQEIFEGIVQDGVDSGVFETGDVKMATFAIAGMCNWLSTWYQKDGRLTSDRIGDVFSELILGGLLKRDAKALKPRATPATTKAPSWRRGAAK